LCNNEELDLDSVWLASVQVGAKDAAILNKGEEIYLTHNNDLVATEAKSLAACLEIKASTLNQDIISIIEGIIDLTPVDPAEFTWLLKMETLTETLDDDELLEDYEDAFKEEWTQFVKDCENSGAKYVMIDGKK